MRNRRVCFGPRPVTALDLRRFTWGTDQIRSPGSVRVIAGALRCNLRFREIGGDPAGGLRAPIPGAGHWRLATLPAVLSPTRVDDLLAAFTGPIPSLRRACERPKRSRHRLRAN